MFYRTYVPGPPLSDFVDLFWSYEAHDPPHAKERILPTGTMELIVDLREEELRVYDGRNHEQFQSFATALICGAHSESFVIDTASQASVMGVHFKPGGAVPFVKLAADDLRNAHVSLEALWGAKAIELRDRLLEAQTPEGRFRILERTLLTQAVRPLARHPAVAFALKEFQDAPRTPTISDVSERTGLSKRRLIQVFSDEVGLTPKRFCRVRRFQDVLRLIKREQRVDWGKIALECGYFDQAHFIHDFQAFSGLTPTAYLARCTEHLNHVSLSER